MRVAEITWGLAYKQCVAWVMYRALHPNWPGLLELAVSEAGYFRGQAT
jgi:hypothetical protein